MLSKFPVKQTRETLLKFTSEEQIFEHYLGCPIEIGDKKFHSPLRNDKNPTCSFKILASGRIWFKDWSGHFSGDCFNLVEAYYTCDFKTALLYIDRDLNLNVFDETSTEARADRRQETQKIERTSKERAKIDVKFQPYTQKDLDYWKSQGVVPYYLNEYNVFVAKFIRINGYTIWEYEENNPIYVYLEADGTVKGYRPLEKDKLKKWISNTFPTTIFGLDKLPDKGGLLIITKSKKDIMALRLMGYWSCSPQAEENKFPEVVMENLKSRFKTIIFFYDNDEAGLRKMNEECERFDLLYTHIPTSIEGKDPSGVVFEYGQEEGKRIVDECLQGFL